MLFIEDNPPIAKTPLVLGVLGVLATVLIAAAVVYYWEFVYQLGGYGYVGLFLISIFGGATVLVPIPMLAVQFALAGVLPPWFGPPFLAPFFVGWVAGMGETLGAMTIYMTGYGSGTPLAKTGNGKVQRAYGWVTDLMERRGALALLLLAAVVNPFFYPAALAAGALRFGARRYFFICLVGKTIKGLTIALAGYWGLRGLLRALGMPV